MKKSNDTATFVTHFSEQVAGKTGSLKKHLAARFSNLLQPLNLFSRNPVDTHTPRNTFTHIIIICLSYPGLNRPDGTRLDLQGPKHDFSLLLNHFNYLKGGNQAQFTLLNDFDYFPKHGTSCAEQNPIPKTDTSKKAIRDAIRSTMQRITPGSRVFLHFSGHGSGKAVIAGDAETIEGSELRSWISSAPHSSVPVTAVFDCCSSGDSFGLPYTYEATSDSIEVQRDTWKKCLDLASACSPSTRKKSSIPILQISAARQGQSALSREFSGGYHGQLTWYMLRYLDKNPQTTTIDDIAHFLNKRFNCHEGQMPQLSCSQNLRGQFPFF
ncbi:Ca(2+)-dependent cysteine protease [Tulasnella sp. 424]|nr:Ca(2+)-dependent cysteine protease [Tulasnella sp. 424]